MMSHNQAVKKLSGIALDKISVMVMLFYVPGMETILNCGTLQGICRDVNNLKGHEILIDAKGISAEHDVLQSMCVLQ